MTATSTGSTSVLIETPLCYAVVDPDLGFHAEMFFSEISGWVGDLHQERDGFLPRGFPVEAVTRVSVLISEVQDRIKKTGAHGSLTKILMKLHAHETFGRDLTEKQADEIRQSIAIESDGR